MKINLSFYRFPLLLCLSLLAYAPTEAQKLKKTEVTEKIYMSLPADFRPMTDEEIASKYFSTQRPAALYTDLNGLVDVGVNKSVTQWAPKDIDIMKDFQKSNIYNNYDEIEMLSEGIRTVNKKQFVYFEFISTINPDKDSFTRKGAIKKYTYIQYTVYGGQSLVFNFTCSERIHSQWKKTADNIMQSIIIKGRIK